MKVGKTESYPCDVEIGDIGFVPGLGKHKEFSNIKSIRQQHLCSLTLNFEDIKRIYKMSFSNPSDTGMSQIFVF